MSKPFYCEYYSRMTNRNVFPFMGEIHTNTLAEMRREMRDVERRARESGNCSKLFFVGVSETRVKHHMGPKEISFT